MYKYYCVLTKSLEMHIHNSYLYKTSFHSLLLLKGQDGINGLVSSLSIGLDCFSSKTDLSEMVAFSWCAKVKSESMRMK